MLNLPLAFTNKYRKLLGPATAQKFFAALNEPSKKAFRVNPLKYWQNISYSKKQPVPGIKNAFYGAVTTKDPEWVSGTVYSQDPAAMFPAALSPLAPGSRVLDLCAAPGGKSTLLGQRLANQGLLVANEISSARAKILRENLERWGLVNTLLTNEKPAVLAARFPHFFDLVLVDAPCSGEGMFRKNPAAINYWSPAYVRACQKRQKNILRSAVQMLSPGGYLLYSTCTFAPEEDEDVVAWLVLQEDLQIEKIPCQQIGFEYGHPEWSPSRLAALKETLRFWPQDNLGEGQFIALLKKKGQHQIILPQKRRGRKKQRQQRQARRLNRQEKALVGQVLDQFALPAALTDWRHKAMTQRGHVFVPVLSLAQTANLRILNNGVELGLLKKKRFEPGHQLAAVLGQLPQKRRVELATRDDYLSYLHGDTVTIDTVLRGFVLISYRGFIFSFGKVGAQGIIKNFYPKGLRILKKE